MSSSLWLSALLLAVLSFNAVKGGPFTVTISTPREQEMGEDVTCQAVISNNHDEDYYLLKRNTPLEKIRSHIFNVKKGRNTLVQYDGFLYKRAPPTEEEYVLVPGKTSVSSKVVLSDAYSFDGPSVYSVQLDTQVLYSKSLSAAPLSQPLSSNTRHFFLANTGKAPKLTEPEVIRRNKKPTPVANTQWTGLAEPTFSGGWPASEKTNTKEVYQIADDKMYDSYEAVGDNALYRKWFGAADSGRINTVENVYLDMYLATENTVFDFVYHGSDCDSTTVAYTCFNCRDISFCDIYFSFPNTGINSKMGTIIHELTHALESIPDREYGTADCKSLASNNPADAIDNADNYEYYSESL